MKVNITSLVVSIKEITVTDSFLGLNRVTRNCQNLETFDDCKTRLHIETIREKWKCLPLSIHLSDMVNFQIKLCKRQKSLFEFCKQDALCTTNEEISCSKTITEANSTICMRRAFYLNWMHLNSNVLFSPCSGLVVSGYSHSGYDKSLDKLKTYLDKSIGQYKIYKKMYIVDNSTDLYEGKSKMNTFFTIFIMLNNSFFTRLWFWTQTEICEDLLLCYNIWQNYQGQSSKVCGHALSYWRNHGTSHWVLHYQWSGDCLLWRQTLRKRLRDETK